MPVRWSSRTPGPDETGALGGTVAAAASTTVMGAALGPHRRSHHITVQQQWPCSVGALAMCPSGGDVAVRRMAGGGRNQLTRHLPLTSCSTDNCSLTIDHSPSCCPLNPAERTATRRDAATSPTADAVSAGVGRRLDDADASERRNGAESATSVVSANVAWPRRSSWRCCCCCRSAAAPAMATAARHRLPCLARRCQAGAAQAAGRSDRRWAHTSAAPGTPMPPTPRLSITISAHVRSHTGHRRPASIVLRTRRCRRTPAGATDHKLPLSKPSTKHAYVT